MVGEALPVADSETFEFDTLSAAGNLKNAGIDAGHADAIAAAIGKAVNSSRHGLATKQDLHAEFVIFRYELKADIAALKHELKADIAEFRQVMIAQIAAVREEMRLEIKESEKRMSDMENRLTLRLAAAIVAVNTLMFLALQVFG